MPSASQVQSCISPRIALPFGRHASWDAFRLPCPSLPPGTLVERSCCPSTGSQEHSRPCPRPRPSRWVLNVILHFVTSWLIWLESYLFLLCWVQRNFPYFFFFFCSGRRLPASQLAIFMAFAQGLCLLGTRNALCPSTVPIVSLATFLQFGGDRNRLWMLIKRIFMQI